MTFAFILFFCLSISLHKKPVAWSPSAYYCTPWAFVCGCVLMPACVCFLCSSVHEGLVSASFIHSLSYCVLGARPKLTSSFKSEPLWTETTAEIRNAAPSKSWHWQSLVFSMVQKAREGFSICFLKKNSAHMISIYLLLYYEVNGKFYPFRLYIQWMDCC